MLESCTHCNSTMSPPFMGGDRKGEREGKGSRRLVSILEKKKGRRGFLCDASLKSYAFLSRRETGKGKEGRGGKKEF